MGFVLLSVWKLLKSFVGAASVCVAVILSGCNSLTTALFYPHEGHYQTPDILNVDYQTIVLDTDDGFQLTNWLLLPDESIPMKGTILYLHGNGENISTHMNSVAWLTLQGYQVFLLDYRGYGESTGTSTLESALSDIQLAHYWLNTNATPPLFLFGQSMGGALAITYTSLLAESDPHAQLTFNALISESAPASWPQVAREAMSKSLITWIAVPATALIPSKWDAQEHIKHANLPTLLMHSRKDQTVGFQHFEQLKKAAGDALNLKSYETNGNHTQGLAFEQARRVFLTFLEANSAAN